MYELANAPVLDHKSYPPGGPNKVIQSKENSKTIPKVEFDSKKPANKITHKDDSKESESNANSHESDDSEDNQDDEINYENEAIKEVDSKKISNGSLDESYVSNEVDDEAVKELHHVKQQEEKERASKKQRQRRLHVQNT